MIHSISLENRTRTVSQMASVPKHPHHDDKHSRHAADLSHHTQRLGFSINNMDASADPRQDFYRFAAGHWLDEAVIPDEDAQVGGFIGLFHLLNEQILTLLRDAADRRQPEASLATASLTSIVTQRLLAR